MKTISKKHVKRLGKLSDELYQRIMSQVDWRKTAEFKNRMVHLADCVDCGTITPLDAYDAIDQLVAIGYLPEFITVRKSNYSHLF